MATPQIQTTYPNGQARGQAGQKSRTSAPYNGDRVKIGAAGLEAGAAFTLNGSGEAIPLTSTTQGVRVEGVLMYEASALNDEATGAIGEYAVGKFVPYMEEGYIYAVAGETIAKGANIGYNPTTNKWIDTGLPVATQLKVLTAVDDAVLDDVIEVKVGARVVATA